MKRNLITIVVLFCFCQCVIAQTIPFSFTKKFRSQTSKSLLLVKDTIDIKKDNHILLLGNNNKIDTLPVLKRSTFSDTLWVDSNSYIPKASKFYGARIILNSISSKFNATLIKAISATEVKSEQIKVIDPYFAKALEMEGKANDFKTKAEKKFDDAMRGLKLPENSADEDRYNLARKTIEDEYKKDLDQVEFQQKVAKSLRYRSKTLKSFNWFFVKNAIDAELFYNGEVTGAQSKFLSNSLLSFANDGSRASLFEEVYADYFGPIRIGIGALISNKGNAATETEEKKAEETQKDAFQRLLGGGGNAVVNVSYPLIDGNGSGGLLSYKLIAAPKASLDLPKIGTESNTVAWNGNVGLEGSVFYTGSKSIITFFSNFRMAHVFGDAEFYNNIKKTDKKGFMFNQVSLGIGLSSTFRISYNLFFGSSFVNDNVPKSISLTLVPKF